MTPDDCFATWNSWLGTIHTDIRHTLVQRYIWREVQTIIETNPRIHQAGTFYDWMAHAYTASAVLGVRRQIDRDERSISLLRLLESIRKQPQVMSRNRYLATYGAEGHRLPLANGDFDRFAGACGSHVDPQVVKSDIDDLCGKCGSITSYANKKIAHTDMAQFDAFPTFADLNACLDTMERLLRKYLLLLRAEWHAGIVPTWQFDWKVVFRFPWIHNEQ